MQAFHSSMTDYNPKTLENLRLCGFLCTELGFNGLELTLAGE